MAATQVCNEGLWTKWNGVYGQNINKGQRQTSQQHLTSLEFQQGICSDDICQSCLDKEPPNYASQENTVKLHSLQFSTNVLKNGFTLNSTLNLACKISLVLQCSDC